MINHKNTKVLVAAALILFVAGTAAQAATFTTSGLDPNNIVVRSNARPLAPQSITQNTDPNTIVPGTVACGAGGFTTENSYFRLFDLDLDHNLTGDFCAEDVDYAVETAVDLGVPQTTVINIACLDDGLPYLGSFLTPVGSGSQVQPDAEQEFFNLAVSAGSCCDSATQSMSVELQAPLDCTLEGCGQLYYGSNNLGQIAPTYLASASCGITDPTDIAGIGFPDVNIILVVNGDGTDGGGTDGGDDGGDDVVPASNGIGIALMLVLLLGSSAYFMRRRALN